MNHEHVTATRRQSSLYTAPVEIQERRIASACVIILLSVLLLLISVPSLRAQDLYLQSNMPRPGVGYLQQWAQPSVVDPKPGGLSQNWDFSNLVPNKLRTDSVKMLDPASVIGNIPSNCNVVVRNSTNNSRTYYNTKNLKLSYLGQEDNNKTMKLGTFPYDIEPIPVKFNSMLSSRYDGTLQLTLQPGVTIRRSNTVTFTPDGDGTLTLPGQLATNAIRVRWTEDIRDTLLQGPVAQYAAHTVLTRYVWYAKDSPIELLVINQGNVSFTKIKGVAPKDSLVNEVTYYLAPLTVSTVVVEDSPLFKTAPNPADQHCTVLVPLSLDLPTSLRLVNELGEEVMLQHINPQGLEARFELDLRHLSSGRYIILIEQNGIIRRRLLSVVH